MKKLTVVQLSDPHLCAEGKLLHGTIDAWARLRAALHSAKHFNPDVVVVTGDIADRGALIHGRAAKLFAKFQDELGCPIITVPGNHDPQDSINEAFNVYRLSTGPRIANTVHEINGLRIIGLDSGGYRESKGSAGYGTAAVALGPASGPGTARFAHCLAPPAGGFPQCADGRTRAGESRRARAGTQRQ